MDIELVLGDIADQPDMDAVVNAANAQLRPGGGVAGAIHRAAGPELDRACRVLAPIRPGEAVITPAFGLPNRSVIHCLGPVYSSDEPARELLARCYRRAMELASEHGLESIAFPLLSTGVFGYPLEEGAEVAVGAVLGAGSAAPAGGVRRVRFVVRDREAAAAVERALAGAGRAPESRPRTRAGARNTPPAQPGSTAPARAGPAAPRRPTDERMLARALARWENEGGSVVA
ncbi:MAG TPA: macro domain-containing protein [Phycisphaerales bacterium]|nr:macro domain-containing protein [Phycisphaerales bacterium]